MTKRELRQRRSAIISQLAQMSRGGWINSSSDEYRPLERELDEIDAKLGNGQSRRSAVRRHEQKIADRVDGYDRDDLGESPDF